MNTRTAAGWAHDDMKASPYIAIAAFWLIAALFGAGGAHADICDALAAIAAMGAQTAIDHRPEMRGSLIEYATQYVADDEKDEASRTVGHYFDIGYQSGDDPEKVRSYVDASCTTSQSIF